AWLTVIVSPVTDRGASAGSIDAAGAGSPFAAFGSRDASAFAPWAFAVGGFAEAALAVAFAAVERLLVRAVGETTVRPPTSEAARRAAASWAPARPASTDGSGVSRSVISSSGIRDRSARAGRIGGSPAYRLAPRTSRHAIPVRPPEDERQRVVSCAPDRHTRTRPQDGGARAARGNRTRWIRMTQHPERRR